MEKRKTYITVTILFITYIALVFFCCLYSFSGSDLDLAKYFLGIRLDRYVHFTMFFPYPFAAWLFLNYNSLTKTICKYSFPIIIISGLILAAVAESSQSLVTENRQSDYLDYVANATAILTGTAIIAIFKPQIKGIFDFFFAKKWSK
ncbi:MAG: hypothetical protein Q4B21_01230 [Bacteroidia bacterium]|nr:hypothetical protein [Bacteroidia bacterium]